MNPDQIVSLGLCHKILNAAFNAYKNSEID